MGMVSMLTRRVRGRRPNDRSAKTCRLADQHLVPDHDFAFSPLLHLKSGRRLQPISRPWRFSCVSSPPCCTRTGSSSPDIGRYAAVDPLLVLWHNNNISHFQLNLLRCLLIPVVYGVYLVIAQNFLIKSNDVSIVLPRQSPGFPGESVG